MARHNRRAFLRRAGLVAVPAVVGGGLTMPGAANATAGAVPAALRPGGTFDQYLSGLAANDQFSGTVLVAHDGRPVFSRSFGYADRSRGVSNRADTVFCLASVTKLFTAIAVAQLAQQGSLTLVDPIGKHLTGFAADVADTVTIHHLLTHTSGLGDFTRDAGYLDESVTWTTPQQMMDNTLRYVRSEALAFAPGAGNQYSNSGYQVLGSVIQQVSGQSYYDYVRTHVFEPAGMKDSGFITLPQWRSGARYAHPYPADPSGQHNDALADDVFAYIGNPAGNALASAPDMVRFVRALTDGTLLNAAYREVFLTPKLPRTPLAAEPEEGRPAVTPFASYAPDNFLINDQWVLGHLGGAPGVSTGVSWTPTTGWTAVALSNYDPSPDANVSQELRRILAG
ncbi:serine hydrolase domain-containing protein [Hamadaea sp. NPDC051192]|uniref:serine hydrolase domain-containing protein n=1 Tax=Hamadaea sp. NPDC051192 TaxID=3154940 RepID=UPI00343261F3